MSRLVLKDEQGHTAEFSLSGDAVIGRSRSCAVRIKNKNISREHTRIFFRDGVGYAMDLGSKNGTLVNGEQARGPVQLHTGDKISIGGMQLIFMGDDPHPASRVEAEPRPAVVEPPPQAEAARAERPAEAHKPPAPETRRPTAATAAPVSPDTALRNFVVRVMVTVFIVGFFVAVVFASRMIFTKLLKG